MKKKNFKKPLLVCLSVLTLFSASATSIASSVIDNQPKVVHRVKKAHEVNGASYKISCGSNTYDLIVNPSNNQEVMLTDVYFNKGDVLTFKKIEGSSTWNHGIQLKEGVDKTKVSLSSNGYDLTILDNGYYAFYLDVSNNIVGYLWAAQTLAITISNNVEGVFSVEGDGLLGYDSSFAEFDIRALTYNQTPLGGNDKFAVVFTNLTKGTYDLLDSGNLFPEIGGKLASIKTFTQNGVYAVVCEWNGSSVGKDDILDFTYDDRAISESQFTSLVEELNQSGKMYGGYFSGNLTSKNIPGMVVEDTSGPLISGSQKTYTTSVDSPISVEIIKSALTAIDETDGNVTSSIVVKSDNYTANNKKLGSYDIVFEASDTKGNKSTLTVTVVVQDLVYPVINGADTQSFSYTAAKTLDDIKALYTVSDNYDTSLSISVDSQSPDFDGTKVGTYNLVLSVTDSSNHKTTKNIVVNIIDDVAPVISGSTSFVTNNATSTTLDDIKSRCGISAMDTIDGECSVTIKSETLTGNANKVGNYYVIFESVDTKGNRSELRVEVSITDGIPPVFYIDETIIYAANNIAMTNVDLCNLMIATCEIDASKPYSLAITDTNGYLTAASTGEEVPVGNYEVIATVTYKDGNKDVYTKTISVYDPDSVDLETKEVKKNFFECIVQFFKNWKAAWDEGGFKLWWQKLWNGDLFKENMTKIVEVEKEVERVTSETSGK